MIYIIVQTVNMKKVKPRSPIRCQLKIILNLKFLLAYIRPTYLRRIVFTATA